MWRAQSVYFSCSDSSLDGGGLFFTRCQFLMQNFCLRKEMHNRYILRLCGPQRFSFAINSFGVVCLFVSSSLQECAPWEMLLRSSSKCILDWICQASYSVQASLRLVTRYGVHGVCTRRGMGAGRSLCVSRGTGRHISGVCHPWPITARRHRAISCLDLQCDNTGVIHLQGRINGSASLLTCSDVARLS